MIFGLVVFAAVVLVRRVASSAGHLWRRRRVEIGRAGQLQLAAPRVVNGIYLVNETPYAGELEHARGPKRCECGAVHPPPPEFVRVRPWPREVERARPAPRSLPGEPETSGRRRGEPSWARLGEPPGKRLD